MRIDKPVAMGVLSAEISRLTVQTAACNAQFASVVAIETPGLAGFAAQEFRANVRRYSVVLLTHSYLYQAIRTADQQNLALVAALPTTNGLVLDTNVAQARIDAAETEIARLRAEKERVVNEAIQINNAINVAAKLVAPVLPVPVKPICIEAIDAYYDALITVQFTIIEYYRMILARAEQYASQSMAIYRAIDLNAIERTSAIMSNLISQGIWGSMSWSIELLRRYYKPGLLGLGTQPSKPIGSQGWRRRRGRNGNGSGSDSQDLWRKFLNGELGDNTVGERKSTDGSVDVFGVPMSFGYGHTYDNTEWSVKPGDLGFGPGNAHGSIEGEYKHQDLNIFQYLNYGDYHIKHEQIIGDYGLYGEAGFSAAKNGQVVPGFHAHATGDAALVTDTSSISYGNENEYVYFGDSTKLLSLSGEAGGNLGSDGLGGGAVGSADIANRRLSVGGKSNGSTYDLGFSVGYGVGGGVYQSFEDDAIHGRFGVDIEGVGIGLDYTICLSEDDQKKLIQESADMLKVISKLSQLNHYRLSW